MTPNPTQAPPPISHRRAWIELVAGVLVIITGVVITITSFGKAEASGTQYILAFGPVVAGVTLVMHALSDLAGYRSFVAWRYLLVAQRKVTARTKLTLLAVIVAQVASQVLFRMSTRDILEDPLSVKGIALLGAGVVFLVVLYWGVLRHSRPAMWVFLFGLGIGVLAQIVIRLMLAHKMPFLSGLAFELQAKIAVGVAIGGLVGFGLAGLATFFGTLRAFFTFFTTVPIGGVWIGTAALVCVLSVMSGFESDLREKILGSNAHIQITREDGEFTDWRAIKGRIDRIPGVVASTPYAVSEVVIAAHNNGMNVIIKGIDPATVAKVTDLVSDLEDREAIKRLEPIAPERPDLIVPQTPHEKDATDPAPDDLPTAADPIDFSGSGEAAGSSSDAGSGSGASADPPPRRVPGTQFVPDESPSTEPAEPPAANEPFGGEARGLQRAGAEPPSAAIDLPPGDFLTADTSPADYSSGAAAGAGSGGRDFDSLPINVVDFPESTVSRRTQSLPGVLVGRELVKQTHLYTGEEVRVVSPLSDPSNPDATGTPIPFNRDYRVAGIFFTGMYEYDLKYVYVTLESLQDFLDRGDAIDGIEVRITDADDTGRYLEILGKELGPGYRIVDWRELNRSLFSALKLEKIAMFLVLGIVILVASFSIVGNLIMVVVEKAREIALLKTLGASNFGVMQLFAIQGLMIGMIGTALGIATGLLACWAGAKYGLPLNPDVYYIDRLPIHVDPQSVAAAAAAGILISIAATLYPALLAARVRPAAGMRH